MDPELRVVTQLPLAALWDEDGSDLDARRVRTVGRHDMRELLRSDARVGLATANVGSPLRWVSVADRFEVWKAEIQPRLVEPPAAESGFHLEDFPDGLAYICSEWQSADGSRVILAEAHH